MKDYFLLYIIFHQTAEYLTAGMRSLNLTGHVGFDSLPDQLVNKSVAQGFCFNILCVGKFPFKLINFSFHHFIIQFNVKTSLVFCFWSHNYIITSQNQCFFVILIDFTVFFSSPLWCFPDKVTNSNRIELHFHLSSYFWTGLQSSVA